MLVTYSNICAIASNKLILVKGILNVTSKQLVMSCVLGISESTFARELGNSCNHLLLKVSIFRLLHLFNIFLVLIFKHLHGFCLKKNRW